MGLKNLKSVFSNIELPSPTPKKQGVDTDPSLPTPEKQSPIIYGNEQSNLITMRSAHSLDSLESGEPQEVDYMGNTQAVGFTANQVEGNNTEFVGAELTQWNSTTGFYTISNITVSGPVDWLHNDNATGFTLNQLAGNNSLFVGIENTDWDPTTSLYNVSNVGVPGPVDWMGNDKATGFTLNQLAGNDTFFVGAGDVPTGGGGNFSNTSLYSGVGWDSGEVTFLGNTYSFDNGLPAIDATTWTIPTNFTYQNSQYGVNAISETFGGPVDFMSGVNSYYPTLNPKVPGFTKGFGVGSISYDADNIQIVDGLPSGYIYGDGQEGNSKYLNIETGTHTSIPIHPYDNQSSYLTGATKTFSDTVGGWFTDTSIPPHGTTWNVGETSLTSYYDNIHTTNAISDAIFGPVDFMSGLNSYYGEVNLTATPTGIPGFTNYFGISHLVPNDAVPPVGVEIGATPIGYNDSPGNIGISKFITSADGVTGTMISTGTHTDRPFGDGTTVSFSDTWSFSNQIPTGTQGNTTDWTIPENFTYSTNTSIPTQADGDDDGGPFTGAPTLGGIYSAHPNPTTYGNITSGVGVGTGYAVDFFGINGNSTLLAHSLLEVSGSLSGFDVSFTSNGASGTAFGNSKYSTMIAGLTNNVGNVLAGTLEDMYTGLGSTGLFDGTGTTTFTGAGFSALSTLIPSGVTGSTDTWNITGNYYDGIHSTFPNPTTYSGPGGIITSGGTGGTGYLVDFMDSARHASYGAHTHWAGSGSLSGFDESFNSSGYTEENPFGSSKYIGMMDTLTGLTTDTIWSGRLESIYTGTNGTISFGTAVDFMSAVNDVSYGAHSHFGPTSSSMTGFDLSFTTNTPGQTFGSSKYSGMMNGTLSGLTGTIYSGRLEDIYTKGSGKISFGTNVNFMDGTIAKGFEKPNIGFSSISTISSSLATGGVTWTLPSTTYYDNYTFNKPTWSFATQQSTGLNFDTAADTYATGFTVGQGHLYHTDFIGMAEGIATSRVEWDPVTTSYFDNYSNVPSSDPAGEPFSSQQTSGVNFMDNTAQVGTKIGDITDDIAATENSLDFKAAQSDVHALGFTPGLTGISDTQFRGVTADGDILTTGLIYTKPVSQTLHPHNVVIGYPNTNVPGELSFTYGQSLTFETQKLEGSGFIVGTRTDLEGTWTEWTGFNTNLDTPGTDYYKYSWWNGQTSGLSTWYETHIPGYVAPKWSRLPGFESSANNRILPIQSAKDIFSSTLNFDKSDTGLGYGPDASTSGTKNALSIGAVVSDPIFLATQLLLQFHNPRNQKIWNPLSLASGIPIGPFKVGLSRGNWFGLFDGKFFGAAKEGGGTETYINTVAELGGAKDITIGTGNINASGAPAKFEVVPDGDDPAAPNSMRDDATLRTLGMKFSGGVAYQVLGDNAKKGQTFDGSDGFPTSLLDVAPGLIHPTLGIAGDLISAVVPNSWTGVEEFLNNYNATRQQYVTRDKTYKTDWLSSMPLASNIQYRTDMTTAANKLGKRKSPEEDNSFGTFSNLKKSLTNVELGDYSSIPDSNKKYSDSITKAAYTSDTNWQGFVGTIDDSFDGDTSITNYLNLKPNRRFGDLFTVLNPLPGANKDESLKNARLSIEDQYGPTTKEKIEGAKYGMPMYFKDLRDNRYITFRAFLTGIAENITPTWNTHEYIGRSEPVYRYQSTQREINFTLTLFAHTRDEFEVLHMKLNRVTSMCYPEYMKDNAMAQNSNLSKIRMKPPLVKLRIGEWLGNSTNEGLTGFIQTLATTIPEEAPWETERNYRSPKMFQLTFQFKVIHGEVPALIKQSEMNVEEAALQASSYQQFYGFSGYEPSTATTTE